MINTLSSTPLEYGILLSSVVFFTSIIYHASVDDDDVEKSEPINYIFITVLFLLLGALFYNAVKCLRSGKKCVVTASLITLFIIIANGFWTYRLLTQIINAKPTLYTVTKNGETRTTYSKKQFEEWKEEGFNQN